MNDSTTTGQPAIVVDANGVEGTIIADRTSVAGTEQLLLVHFQNGEQVLVPRTLLKQQADGRYRLLASLEGLARSESALAQTAVSDEHTLVTPIIEENVTVQKRVVETGRVEIRKTVHERTEVVDQPLHMEQVEIERVAINRVIDEPLSIRREGETLIIPLLEEVLVIEKRLVLREEVHIKKLQTTVQDPQEVRLRAEQVEVIRTPGNEHISGQGEVQQE